MAAKVRPALVLPGQPAANELDLTTVLLHTTAVRIEQRFPPSRREPQFALQTCGLPMRRIVLISGL